MKLDRSIMATSGCTVFTDMYEKDEVWLSVQTPSGSAHCTIKTDQVKTLITYLLDIIEAQEAIKS